MRNDIDMDIDMAKIYTMLRQDIAVLREIEAQENEQGGRSIRDQDLQIRFSTQTLLPHQLISL